MTTTCTLYYEGILENRILLISKDLKTESFLKRMIGNMAEIFPVKDVQHGLSQLTRYTYQLVVIGALESIELQCRVIRIIQDISDNYILCLGIEGIDTKQKLIEAGADMALSFDCNYEEAKLLLRAILRRASKQETLVPHDVVHVGNLRMDYYHRKVWWQADEIKLTKKEYDFLYLLAAVPGRVYTFD